MSRDDQIKVVVGLGNPGKKYKNSPHNVGFEVLDSLLTEDAFVSHQGVQCATAKLRLFDRDILFLKPLNFMNLSGVSVGAFLRKKAILSHSVMVVHDDMDIADGELRIKWAGGAGGHHGIESMIEHCSNEFHRLRVGVGKPIDHESADYLLSPVSKSRMKHWVELAKDALILALEIGPRLASNQINKKR